MRAVVAGGGIVGLTTAIALRRRGIDVVVHEQAPEIRAVGAGLGLWANALAVFDELGLGEQLRAIGRPAEMYFRDHTGRLIDPPGFTKEDHSYLLVHRGRLNELLAGAAGPENIRLNSRLVGYEETASGVTVHLGDGTSTDADLLIGADGAYSVVRSLLVPGSGAVEHRGHHAWRAVVPPPPGVTIDTGVIVLGEDRSRGGYVPTVDGTVYWLVNQFEVTGLTGSAKDQARRRAALSRWVSGRVALVGDAAHALSPHITAGASLGVEDPLVLARLLGSAPGVPEALAAYERDRLPHYARVNELSQKVEDSATPEEFAANYAAFTHWMLA